MRLYMNSKGEWVGTQAEAKKIGATMVDVPTDKPNLLKWLNTFTGKIDEAAEEVIENKTKPGGVTLKAHAWDTIRECAEKATINDMTVALAVYMDRVLDIADKQKETQQ
tara:strand:- start:417 stop:743 length:327 start_codon:yes stop_codon:yes gene_type:complete